MRTFVKNVTRCGKECPAFKRESGMGYDDDWDVCLEKSRILEFSDRFKTISGFPAWCPLKEEK